MRRLWLILAALGLAACATEPPEEFPEPSPFQRALAERYAALSAEEIAEDDWIDGPLFARKAQVAERGGSPEPDKVENRDLREDLVPVFEAQRRRLEIALFGPARVTASDSLAAAQTAFDCWIQEAEEDIQPEDIEPCRDAFLAEMEALERIDAGALVILLPSEDGGAITVSQDESEVQLDDAFSAAASGEEALEEIEAVDEGDVRAVLAGALDAAPRPQRSYLVYFEQGSADLTPESEAVFETALQDALETEAARVTVFGHTDRQGSAALNVRLAQQRAEAMRARLVDDGVDPAAIEADSFGESFPLVPTRDGVAEARNRRVEIAVR